MTLITALCFGTLSACASQHTNSDAPPSEYENLEITLDRTTCYGTCPSYVVKVTGSGQVSYCGFTYVDERGRRTRQVDPNEVRSLYAQILAADFFNLQDEYFANITDGPSYRVSVSVDGQTKAVRDYYGKEAGMPESVTAIQDAIDDVSGTAAWIGGRPHNHTGAIEFHIPDCEDEFRPGAKAFREKTMKLIDINQK